MDGVAARPDGFNLDVNSNFHLFNCEFAYPGTWIIKFTVEE